MAGSAHDINRSVHSDNSDTENRDCNNMANNHRHTGDDAARSNVINTVLGYIQYGISSATPDNVAEVACSHFTPEEIIEAKDVLWSRCDLGGPPSRHNSRTRKASEAHVYDIIDVMFKLDKDEYHFLIESGGIARLPRFNAECLNVVAIDQRIGILDEQCAALKIEASSYRNDFLRCQHQLNIVQTVLQQHTNALRDLRGGPFVNHMNSACNINNSGTMQSEVRSNPPTPPVTSFPVTSSSAKTLSSPKSMAIICDVTT